MFIDRALLKFKPLLLFSLKTKQLRISEFSALLSMVGSVSSFGLMGAESTDLR
jgi:hypothetical protein